MNPQIEVDDDVFELLKRHAEPFVDTPSSVLRRLLITQSPSKSAARGGQKRTERMPARARKDTKRTTKPTTPRTRAAAGSLLPEDRYELPLLQALLDLGGRAPYREVVERVGKALENDLTAVDREKLSSGAIRWQNRLQFVRLRLIERGLLERDIPRGVWGITSEGKAAAQEGRTR